MKRKDETREGGRCKEKGRESGKIE